MSTENVFTLTIVLGNEAMETAEEVASALRDVANALDGGVRSGSPKDINGNSVGFFGANHWPEEAQSPYTGQTRHGDWSD